MTNLSHEIRDADAAVDHASKELIAAQNRGFDLMINSSHLNRHSSEVAVAKVEIDRAQRNFWIALDKLKDVYRRATKDMV
jgi:hypothetical protein